jgi:hypothetical protein
MDNHVVLNDVETVMKSDGFAMCFVANSSLRFLLYGFHSLV